MAHNPQAPHGPEGITPDPAGSTQMFRAFVDDGGPQRAPAAPAQAAGPRIGLIAGVIVAIAVVAVVAWVALS